MTRTGSPFLAEQLRFPRYRAAAVETSDAIAAHFEAAGLSFPPHGIFIRILKLEQVLELWAQGARDEPFQLVKAYPAVVIAGRPGPKRSESDGQTPEGFYHINRFNPASKFYLSLAINYPNRSDRILGDRTEQGGEISIHGGCVTMGCIPITDQRIKELYVIAAQTHAAGQRRIPVHIFPRRLDAAGLRVLAEQTENDSALIPFWKNLMVGFNFFETTRTLPAIEITPDGRYSFTRKQPVAVQ